MALVDYGSDSSASESGINRRPLKRKRSIRSDNEGSLPPLPSSFRDLYSASVRTSKIDDPSLHGGRQRVVPHIAGNWPTHVYTEWQPSLAETSILSSIIKRVAQDSALAKTSHGEKQIHSFLSTSLGAPQPLHISLSRSLSLDTPQHDSFPSALEAAINKAGVPVFSTNPISLRWVPNYTRTRWFLVLQLERPEHDELNQLLRACNSVARAFGRGELYTGRAIGDIRAGPLAPGEDVMDSVDIRTPISPNEPRGNEALQNDPFHISIAWSLSEPQRQGIDVPLFANNMDKIQLQKDLQKLRVPIDAVKAKVGNTITGISLQSKASWQQETRGRERWLGI